MAPLYHRYIPPSSAIGNAPPSQSIDTPNTTSIDFAAQSTSKKRKREDVPEKSSAHDRAPTENDTDLVVQANGRAIPGDNLEDDPRTSQLTGEFAHVRSTKKRHKLEKEARKARKLAEKSKGGDASVACLKSDKDEVAVAKETEQLALVGDQPSTGQSSPQDVEQTSPSTDDDNIPLRTIESRQRAKARSRPSTEDETVTDQTTAHLDKHRSILQKFQKSQKVKPVDQPRQSNRDEAAGVSKTELPQPLEPFEIDIDNTDSAQGELPSISSRPSWLTEPTIVAQESAVSFSQLGLASTTVQRLEEMDLHSALPVQRTIIPLLLPPGAPGSAFADGTQSVLPDLAVSAPTGSGKTLAYLLPMIESLKLISAADRRLRGLVIVPTRELVSQVAQVATNLAKGSDLRIGSSSTGGKFKDEQKRLVSTEQVYDPVEYARATQVVQDITFPPNEGSSDFDAWLTRMDSITTEGLQAANDVVLGTAAHSLSRASAVDVLVCTPGRLVDHLKSTSGFSISHVSWLIIDEADKLLDDQYGNFLDQLHQELARPRAPREQDAREKFLRHKKLWNDDRERVVRRVILSATMTHDVSQLAMLRLQRPKLIVVQQENAKTTQLLLGQDSDLQQKSDVEMHDGEQYQIPATLSEYCVPAGEGNDKPLYLLRLLESKLLTQKQESGSDKYEMSDSDSDVSTDSSSVVSTSSSNTSSDDALSLSSGSMTGSHHSDKLDSRPVTQSKLTHRPVHAQPGTHVPTVLIFVASNEAAMRLSHLLKLLRPDLASSVITWTKNISKLDLNMQMNHTMPYLVISTDRAGRGLDTLAGRFISHVVQYDVPRSVVAYVHRVGRTARAGRTGHAWTLYTKTEARWFIKEVTRASSIHRSAIVERVRINIDDDQLHHRYESALAGMKETLAADGRG